LEGGKDGRQRKEGRKASLEGRQGRGEEGSKAVRFGRKEYASGRKEGSTEEMKEGRQIKEELR
jgi:hypothetical protein